MDTIKQTELIRNQIKKLDAPDFDLEAWKNSTILVLSRVFGESSLIVSRIQSLSYHLSSWALRDTLGKTSAEEQVKRNAREMLETAILELETLGTPEGVKSSAGNPLLGAISSALENEMKVSQYKALREILTRTHNDEKRVEKVHDFLAPFDAESLRNMLAEILGNKSVAKDFPQS